MRWFAVSALWLSGCGAPLFDLDPFQGDCEDHDTVSVSDQEETVLGRVVDLLEPIEGAHDVTIEDNETGELVDVTIQIDRLPGAARYDYSERISGEPFTYVGEWCTSKVELDLAWHVDDIGASGEGTMRWASEAPYTPVAEMRADDITLWERDGELTGSITTADGQRFVLAPGASDPASTLR